MYQLTLKALLVTPALLGSAFALSGMAAPIPKTINSPLSVSVQPKAVDAIAPSGTSVIPPITEQAVAPVSTALVPDAPSSVSVASLEPVTNASDTSGALSQVTSVSQLSDVQPSDWAFQALQSLVERYGCIVGYPDRTFRGNRALSRYEFAAGLNACMDRVNELIAAGTADLVKKEDLVALQKLQEQFSAELATLRGMVDSLEARTAKLEAQQFSTTTKLNGEVIFGIAGAFGDDRAINSDQQRTVDAAPAATRETVKAGILGGQPLSSGSRDVRDNTIFGDRVRIAFDTSFTGKDRLRTQLQARNITPFDAGSTAAGRVSSTGTAMTRLGYDGDSGNAVELRRLEYRFPLGPLTTVFVGTGTNDGLEYNDSVPTINPLFESSGRGAISRFGRFNPIYRVATGTGIIINHKLGREYTFGNNLTVSLGYLVPTANASSPTDDNGIFSGSYGALAQLAYQGTKLGVALTYANAYYNNGSGIAGGTGSGFANNPFGSAGALGSTTNIPTLTNSFGLELTYRVSPKFTVSGWGGYTSAEAKKRFIGSGTAADPVVREGDNAVLWNWAVTLGFPDLVREGDLAGIVFGQPPKVESNDYGRKVISATGARREDSDASYHLEGFYRYQVNDKISITPGLLVIFNPEGNSSNDTIFVGTIRTTFTF